MNGLADASVLTHSGYLRQRGFIPGYDNGKVAPDCGNILSL